MTEKKEETLGPEALLSAWMKAATDFWGPMMPADAATTADKTAPEEETQSRSQKTLESTLKSWQALSAAMSEPDAGQSIFKGMHALPDIMLKMTQTSWESFFSMQEKWSEKAGRIGRSTEAYTFDNLDQEAVAIWRELYEKEFRQLLNMPQLGLTRLYQERANQTLDKFNLYQAAMAEFIHLFFLPLEKSFQLMQEKVAEMAEEGQLPENPKAYYQMWMKLLEGHYMTLLKSPDYTRKMGETLEALTNFKVAKKEILQDFLQDMPVPTEKEMDELYKEIYLLKKRLRELEKNT